MADVQGQCWQHTLNNISEAKISMTLCSTDIIFNLKKITASERSCCFRKNTKNNCPLLFFFFFCLAFNETSGPPYTTCSATSCQHQHTEISCSGKDALLLSPFTAQEFSKVLQGPQNQGQRVTVFTKCLQTSTTISSNMLSDGQAKIWCKQYESIDPFCLESAVQAGGGIIVGNISSLN